MWFWIVVLFGWLFVEWLQRRQAERANDERFSRLVGALNRYEAEIKKLAARVQALETRPSASVEGAPAVHAAEPEIAKPAASTPAPPAVPARPAAPPTAPVPHAPATPHVPPLPAAPHVPSQATPPAMPHESFRPAAPPSPPRVPFSSPHPPVAAPELARRRATELEEKVGQNWLNKIGITVLVIGIALFLAYKFPTLTNPEKVILGYVVSLAILGLGIYLEHVERYRIFARALIGGGWALTFFVTYAMHFVKYTQVIETQWVDLVLLFIVAAAMVAHTLRYDSQVVTGLAFLLAFTTVAISQNTVYCLAAGAILAIGLVAIVHRRRWFELEVFGLAASYINHFIWLRTVIAPMGAHKHMFPEFVSSAVLLCMYWAIYRWSYVAREIRTAAQEHVSTAAALLNTGLLLFLFKYQSVHPQLAFYALLILGAAELAIGQLPVTRRRKTAFVILSTIGTVLLVAAIPFKFSGMDIAILWLAEAQAFLLAGVFTRERVFRILGMLGALLAAGHMIVVELGPVFEARFGLGHSLPELQLAATFGFAALLFYVDALWIPRRWQTAIESDSEQVCFRALSYLAGVMLFGSLWLAFPDAWMPVAWALAAFTLALLGRLLSLDDLSYQAHAFALAAFARTLAFNIDATNTYHGVTLRFITFSIVILLLYLSAGFSGPRDAPIVRVFSAVHSSAGSILAAVLAYKEVSSPWIAVVWAAFALILLVAGDRLKRAELHVQACLLSFGSLVEIALVNLPDGEPFGLYPRVTLRLVTVALVAAIFYASARWAREGKFAWSNALRIAYGWAASVLVVMLLHDELRPLYVALGWALFGLATFEVGMARKSINARQQGYAVLVAAFMRIFDANLGASRHDLLITVLPIAVIFYYVYARLSVSKGRDFHADEGHAYAGTTWSFLGSATVATVLFLALDAGWVAAGWAAFALAALAVAWGARQSVFQYQSLLLAGAVFFRALFFNFAEAGAPVWPWLGPRSLEVGVAIALLFAAQVFAFPLRDRNASVSLRDQPWQIFVRRPEQVFFFVPLALLTILLAYDVSTGRVTMSWGVEAFVVFVFALAVRERSFRLTGLGLLLLCVAKILLLDVWRQARSDRFVTFITLGVALLVVSFLYSRYSDAIKRYL